METTINPTTEALSKRIRSLGNLFATDLNHMTHEVMDSSHGGVARTAYDLAYEVANVNRLVAKAASGDPQPCAPSTEWTKAPESHRVREEAIRNFTSSIEEASSALETCPDERLGEIVESPLGPLPLIEFANVLPLHMMYHSGQLNYIQTIHGDAVFHWGG